MALDPHLTLVDSIKDGTRTPGRIADLERRVKVLENSFPGVVVTAGEPTTHPREGVMAVATTPRLWVYVSGGWHYVALT